MKWSWVIIKLSDHEWTSKSPLNGVGFPFGSLITSARRIVGHKLGRIKHWRESASPYPIGWFFTRVDCSISLGENTCSGRAEGDVRDDFHEGADKGEQERIDFYSIACIGFVGWGKGREEMGKWGMGWTPMPNALGVTAVAYITVDYLREVRPELHSKLQPVLWGFLAVALASRAPFYPHWKKELKSVGVFVASLLFMLSTLMLEAISVQFVTTVLGLDWHWAAAPLPDTGQWLFLYLNKQLPAWMVSVLRAPLVGLHHYLILVLMLGFFVLYDCVKAPGMGLGARYMFSMGIGRLLRVMTFVSTILPSARPWCAHSRFRTASYPHPWAQKYYIPYASNPEMVRTLLKNDELFAPAGEYPAEYVPNWGSMQFLVNILRPPDPQEYPEFQGESWFSTLKRAGGGCNDLIFSGHILVSVLTAMAWTEAYPGWTSGLIWLLVLHSAQREIRERHHYSVDVVSGLYVGILLWRLTGFLWSKRDKVKVLKSELMMKNEGAFVKAAKDGDMEKIRGILNEVGKAGQESSGLKVIEWIYAGSVLTTLFAIVLLIFVWTENG